MTQRFDLTWNEANEQALQVALDIIAKERIHNDTILAYPVPRGGYQAFSMVATHLRDHGIRLVCSPLLGAQLVIDDLIDSGATLAKVQAEAGRKINFYALVDKRGGGLDAWITFPWERSGLESEGIQENIRRLLQWIEGGGTVREGLAETPARVAKAYDRWFGGYGKDPESVLKVFEDGAERVDEMVVVRDIRFYSHCEHHMAPFFGTATVAYIPDGKIVGLSKIARLVDIYARRLQVQERLTTQVADALFKALAPKGVGVILKARHLCIESRGVESIDSTTVTSALLGVFKSEESTRNEFMQFAK